MSLKEIRNLDYTVLLCAKFAETRAFYKDVMGFPVEDDHENWVSFRVGATLLTLRPRGQDPAGGSDGPAEEGSAAVQLAFRVPPRAFESCRTEVVDAGVPIVRDLTDLPRIQHRTLFFRDPEGNLIEIYAEY
ncbi:VOC family protein [Glycomyces salinus]|uniref:VOC family protein n=1 Tax=Glycomyces salinus TaxID=980294 RepID=UPI0018EC59E1|nr:VOC family protein [Glycomyces salinus]